MKEELKPRAVNLTTKDGVRLLCGYFPSDKGKQAVPVILVHEWDGQGRTYVPLALKLQEAGCAVVLPDLRGHGASNTLRNPRTGEDVPIERDRMGRRGAEAMMLDMETVKGFLKEENNAGKLNLNALVVIGVQEGCVLAYNWSAADWNFQTLPGIKQGQDVKAIVLISPEKIIEGITYEQTLRHPVIPRLPTLIVAGAGSQQMREAERLHKLLSRLRQGRGPVDPVFGPADLVAPSTALSGAQLVSSVPEVAAAIAGFIRTHVIAKMQDDRLQWVDRT